MDTNTFYFRGTVVEPVTVSHRLPNRTFYKTVLSVPRLSGAQDLVTLVIPGNVLKRHPLSQGDLVTATGDLRTYHAQDFPHVRLFGFVHDFPENDPGQCPNTVRLTGTLQTVPTFRSTPFNRQISDFILRVNREFNCSTIPAIAWGRYANLAHQLDRGTPVSIVGRMQSRDYTKTLPDGTRVSRTTMEVSCSHVHVVLEG